VPIHKVNNANEVIESCKRLGLIVVGIGGTDLVSGNKKLTLAIVWQLIRYCRLKMLGGLTEEDILKWFNSKLKSPIRNFKDKQLKSGLPFFHCMHSINDKVINWDLVSEETKDDQKMK